MCFRTTVQPNPTMSPKHLCQESTSLSTTPLKTGVLHDARLVVRYMLYITRGARSGVLAELTPGMRSWASLAPRLCTSAYFKGNPWPPGTSGTGRFPWDSGLNMAKEIIDKIPREIIDKFPQQPGSQSQVLSHGGGLCLRTS